MPKYFLFLPLLTFSLSNAFAAATEAELLQQIQNQAARLKNYASPAKSLSQQKNLEQRQAEIYSRMRSEFQAISQAFRAGKNPQERLAAVKTALEKFDAETARDGAARKFEGNAPGLSVFRQWILLPKGKLGAKSAIELISRFERTAKPDDVYIEYSDALALAQANLKKAEGNNQWQSKLLPSFEANKDYTLKKCRKVLFSWYCNTNLYYLSELNDGSTRADNSYSMISFLYDLSKNADHSEFAGDERGKNIVLGYSAAYLTMESPDSLLIYNLGLQDRDDAASFQGRLNDGHKAEYRLLLDLVKKQN